MHLKRYWPYYLIFLACIVAYFISSYFLKNKLVAEDLYYSSASASEVEIVWGMEDGSFPADRLLPAGSERVGKVIHSKLTGGNGRFSIRLQLPYGSTIYYWMVEKKDRAGRPAEAWFPDGSGKTNYLLNFTGNGIFNPGYFIFLAGFLPLIFYFFNGNKKGRVEQSSFFKIDDYIPQFDSIRAIAVCLVIIHHWFSENKVLNFLPNGAIGVNIFFVLSGFLITGILLKSRKLLAEKKTRKALVFRNFYIRRTLRIFPIYYLLLILLLVIGIPELANNSLYYFTYTTNFLFYSGEFFPARLAHLWSLAVEEQFYILWPVLIILVSRRFLPFLIAGFLVIGVSSNYIFTGKSWWIQLLTPACFDAFAIGGFLSFLTACRQDIILKIFPYFRWIFCAVLLIFLLGVLNYPLLPARTTHALLAVSIIYYCLFKKDNRAMNFVLNNKWLMWLGRVSYGVYLYHLFIPGLWIWILKQFEAYNIDLFFNKAVPEAVKAPWLFLQEFAFLLLVCVLSWNFIEKPINKLKKYFDNRRERKKDPVNAADGRSFSY